MLLFNNVKIPIKQFPNGESCLDKPFFEANFAGKNVVTLQYESDADLFQLLLVRKSLWFPCSLHITYFPYSRMDRKSEAYIFTLKSVTKFINWLDFDSVTIYEPHSDVTPALLNKCKIVDLIPPLLKKTDFDITRDYVFYPDAGAQKKYSDRIKSPLAIVGFKKRDFVTGRITDLQITGEDSAIKNQEKWALQEKRVFIIDDLCSKGGTFVLAAEELKKMGAGEIFLVVGHCENTIFDGKVLATDLITRVYTTDSVVRSNDDPKLLSFPLVDLV